MNDTLVVDDALWIVDRGRERFVAVAKGTYRRLICGFLGSLDFGLEGEEHVQ